MKSKRSVKFNLHTLAMFALSLCTPQTDGVKNTRDYPVILLRLEGTEKAEIMIG